MGIFAHILSSRIIMYDEINQKPIIRFLLLKEPDAKGRMLSDLWNKNDLFLEFSHNYIQWMFPLNEGSKHHPNAPILDDEDIQFIQNHAEIQVNMLHSFDIILRFYGFDRDELTIYRNKDFLRKSKRWLTKNNHNFLRITRILKSLKLCGLDAYSEAFFETLVQVYKEYPVITVETMSYWNLENQPIK